MNRFEVAASIHEIGCTVGIKYKCGIREFLSK